MVTIVIDEPSRTAIATADGRLIKKWTNLHDPIESRIRSWADQWGHEIAEVVYAQRTRNVVGREEASRPHHQTR